MINLIAIPLISAAKWDNHKSGLIIDETTSKYGKIEIRNSVFGIPWFKLDKVAELELKKNTDTCGISCSMETEIIMLDAGELIDDIKFLTLQEDDSWKQQGIRSYQFYIKTDGGRIKVTDYETICDVTGKKKIKTKNNITGKVDETFEDELYCYEKETGSHWEDIPNWIPYEMGERVSAGTYTVKLEGKKKPSRTVDWQITSQGKLINEWAVWGAFQFQPMDYFNFNENTGINAQDTGVPSDDNNLTLDTTTTWNSNGKNGATFMGDVDNGLATTINLGTDHGDNEAISLTAWMKVQDEVAVMGGDGIFTGNADSNNGRFIFTTSTDILVLSTRDDTAGHLQKVTPPVDDWFMITLVINSSTSNIYINNTLVNSTALSNYAFDSEVIHFAEYFDGSDDLENMFVDEWAVFNVTLSQEDVTALYNNGDGVFNFNSSGSGIITLNSPVDNYISIINSVDFNATATILAGGATLTNMSLWHNGTGTWHRNHTILGGGGGGSSINYTGADDSEEQIQGTVWRAQTFSVGPAGGTVTGASIPCHKDGNPAGDFIIGLRAVDDGTGKPTGIDLANGSITAGDFSASPTESWEYVEFDTPYVLSPNTNYSIVARAPSGDGSNYLDCTVDNGGSSYAGGHRALSGDSGASWAIDTAVDLWFNVTIIGMGDTQVFTTTITDQTIWNVEACDSDGDCGFALNNRTVLVDTEAPSITITSPSALVDFASATSTLNLNWTVTDDNSDSCWYNYNFEGDGSTATGYTENDDASTQSNGATIAAQQFNISETKVIDKVGVKIYKTNNPDAVNISIYPYLADAVATEPLVFNDTLSIASISGSSPGAWINISFPPIVLLKNVNYMLLVEEESVPPGSVDWRRDQSSPTYANGMMITSTDNGATWNLYPARDHLFELYEYNGITNLNDTVTCHRGDIRYEDGTTKDNLWGVNWDAQTFTTTDAIDVSNIYIELKAEGSQPTGDLTLGIREVNATNHPKNIDLINTTISAPTLSTTTGTWVKFNMGDYSLDASTMYAWVLRCPSCGASPSYNIITASSIGTFAGGNHSYSTSSGSTWIISSKDANFRLDATGFGFSELYPLSGDQNLTFYAQDSVGNVNSSFVEWEYKIFENAETYNTTVYETGIETFSINVTANTSLTAASLIYKGTSYAASQSGTVWSRTLDIPEGVGSNSFNWSFTYAGDTIVSDTSTQTVSGTNFSLCGGDGGSVPFLNFTFKDESDLSVINNGTIPSSTWNYWLGTGTVNKTYTLINNTGNPSYAFCSTPPDRNLTIDYTLQYEDQEGDYIQRLLNPGVLSFSNDTTDTILYLLKSTDGIYVTFQVIDLTETGINDVVVVGTRVIDAVTTTVASGTTDAAGAVTFFLDSDFEHTFTFTATGYDVYTTSIFPTQSSYTIQLGGTTTPFVDYYNQVKRTINPSNNTLFNDTAYDFDLILDSDYWTVSEFGFVLTNSSGSSVASASTSSNGGTATVNYNIGNTTDYIGMNYYWVINGNYTNGSTSWYVLSSSGTDWSIRNFFTDFNNYTSDEGLFGMGNFGKTILVFLIIFMFVGIMSYKFGLVSPAGIAALIFGLVAFFDVGVNLIPDPIFTSGAFSAVSNFPTIIMGLILVGILAREVWR